jgi:ABC-type multidrug transport system ATPase subunit
MLDEPTSNLDAATRSELLALLVGLRREGKALLFTSHHIAEVEQLADQVLLLQDGRLVAQGDPSQLMPQLMPERELPMRHIPTRHIPTRHIKVIVAPGQQPLAEQVLANAGYAASPNGHGLWVTVSPERKAEPLGVLYSAAVEVIDVEL